MIYVIGGRGRLGQEICSFYRDAGFVSLKRDIYRNWWQEGSADEVARYFENCLSENSVIYITAGLLDPRLPEDDHMKINYLLPKNVIRGATKLGMRVVTFGTVMEQLINDQNPYIHSKRTLSNYISDFSLGSQSATHLRIHTLYGGGQPSPFTFLGQVNCALKNKSIFKMSPGYQLREYHHIHDEVRGIDVLLKSGVNGVLDLSHGEPLSLKDLAKCIFKEFKCGSLLAIGALPMPKEENYGTIFQRSDNLGNIKFRKARSGVVSYLKTCFR